MAKGGDRLAELVASETLNGIDFVEIADADQRRLRVHFINASPNKEDLASALQAVTITGGERVLSVEVMPTAPTDWSTDDARRPILNVRVHDPGDFSTYTLRLQMTTPLLDPYFAQAEFSFKAKCPTTLDCRGLEPECSPRTNDLPLIDYLAKDFQSFKKALSDFSALRYPAWQERSEADFGVMFMEALTSLADDLSYLQDRCAAEAWLETATERQSLVRLARLVDYEPRPATAARVMLVYEMTRGAIESIPVGFRVSALNPDGTLVDFEVGESMSDEREYLVRGAWNELEVHYWDDCERCLAAGSTSMWLEDPGSDNQLTVGMCILIDTEPKSTADPPIREIVRLTEVSEAMLDPIHAKSVIEVHWDLEDALRFEHDLMHTVVRANLMPATEGRTTVERFVATRYWPIAPDPPRAVVRAGANGTTRYLHTLSTSPLVWLAHQDKSEGPRPEIRVREVSEGDTGWTWLRCLLQAFGAQKVFTLEAALYRTTNAELGTAEYDGSGGDTLRFGDGVFGAIPVDGSVFEVTYRVGGGLRGNVAADAINRIDRASEKAASIVSVTNPLAAMGGREAETLAQVRERAPQAFRAEQYRAVRAEDFERAAATLPWVQRAGTTFRYTGSWLSVFTSVDPRGSVTLLPQRAAELTHLLNRYRLAGYESFVLAPRYAALDIRVTLCALPHAFRGDVEVAVLETLGRFFHPDHFTFGRPLERSAFEAAIQGVCGVGGVTNVEYRRRGHTPGFIDMPDIVQVAKDEVLRVDNDPSRPEGGSLKVTLMGGK